MRGLKSLLLMPLLGVTTGAQAHPSLGHGGDAASVTIHFLTEPDHVAALGAIALFTTIWGARRLLNKRSRTAREKSTSSNRANNKP